MLPAERTYTVYLATSPSGKVYVGITSKNLPARVSQHYQAARTSASRDKVQCLHHVLSKYGSEMRWEVLEGGVAGREAANLRKKHYIQLFRANDPQYGYNGTEGGDAGAVPNAEVRAKMSQAAKRRGQSPGQLGNLVRGRQDGPAQRRRATGASRFAGHQHTPASREAMSRSQRDVIHTSEWAQKIAVANRHPIARSHGLIFPSAQEAARQMGLSKDAVAKAMRQGRACAGFYFQPQSSSNPSLEVRS